MLIQLLLNIVIAVLWMFLKDEDTVNIQTFFTGYLIGLIVMYLMHRFFGQPFYLRKIWSIIKLITLFLKELIVSSAVVLKQIMSPKLNITPGIFTYETKLTSNLEITALALLLTLTPGSVVMELSPEGRVFYIHAMDIEQSKMDVIASMERFERAIKEVTRT
ncbi:Na+/H+ antiporter subunit E [Kurthia sibirica]|uniref:Na+/H+ antiporter subunit E n=1 Tax=Kurthia sibirica TaxID=202750 RepID=A0A2U3AQ73_9BACL|nr:Na+/H+ antiporter subunit E [Kurthia sibirica]PWI26691.1 Na+/H+ antiporter subunit E [Kurthia sibirica]GEK32960.1 Na+/H+ antiporter subunit E [Kurthia sibirica]